MHEVLVNRFGGLSLPRKSVVRLTDRSDMTVPFYRGSKTTIQQQQVQTHRILYMLALGRACGLEREREREREREGICSMNA